MNWKETLTKHSKTQKSFSVEALLPTWHYFSFLFLLFTYTSIPSLTSHQTEHRVWYLFMLHSSTKYQNTQNSSMPVHTYKKVSCSIPIYSIQFYPRIFLIDCSLFRSGYTYPREYLICCRWLSIRNFYLPKSKQRIMNIYIM